MDRYTYEAGYVVELGDDLTYSERRTRGFLVIDRKRGHSNDQAMARCASADDAQRIVDALNFLDMNEETFRLKTAGSFT